MEQSINLGYFTYSLKFDTEYSLKTLSEAGFKLLDHHSAFTDPGFDKILAEDIKLIEKYGMKVHQTHAPFNRYGAYKDEHIKIVDRTVKATKEFGAKYMVVHGDEFDFANLEYSPERALEYNYDYFAPYVEIAEKEGFKIAFENVFEDAGPGPRYCSTAEQLIALIDRFDSKAVCCCWDFGHGNVSFGWKQPEMIRLVGSRIECTHVHDSRMRKDTHLPPFTGDINWTECMKAFSDIGYDGIMSIEFSSPHSLPRELMPSYARYAYEAADYLSRLCRTKD